MDTPSRHIARSADLVIQEVGDEIVVFDKQTDVAHCLAPVAARVWRMCDGETDFDGIVERLAADGEDDAESVATAALAELADKRLLATGGADPSGYSRRQALGRLAGAGMAAVAAPLVVSTSVASAQGVLSPSCKSSGQACTGSTAVNDDCCGTLVCSTAMTCVSCTASGSKPGGANCSPTNMHRCCSGVCATTGSPNNCG